MIKIILFLSVFIFLTGCGTQTPEPVKEKKVKQTPQWIHSVLPDDNSLYMYGMAIDKDRESAIKRALSSVIARLGITVESSYESIQKVDGAYSNFKVRSTIKANVSKVKLNNYMVIKSYRLNYKEFAVMVKIDKQKFINGLKNELNVKKKRIRDMYLSAKDIDSIKRYNLKKELASEAKSLLPIIYILIELDPFFEKQKNLSFVSEQEKVFIDESLNLKFFIDGNKKSKKFIDKLKNYLAQNNFNIVASKAGAIRINVQTRDNINNDYIQIAVLNLNIAVYDMGKRIGGKELILKERYNNSLESVYKNAAIHLEQEIQEKGINKTIGINLDTN